MDQKIIKNIFKKYNLGAVKSVKKIDIGFTNKVYSINNKFILKVCADENNEENFKKEVYFYDFLKNKILVPEIKVFDKSKDIYERYFMIYLKIEGDNLYSKWHLLNNDERRNILKQLCSILKIINKSPYKKFAKKFKINSSMNWHDKIINKIQNSLKDIEKNKLLSSEFIHVIKKFVKNNHNVLKEQKMALVYWDAHFDNILIQDTKIVGMLDFEKTEISSIDFVLDIIKRMVEYPKKYMSEKSEKFAKKEDYAQLLDWFCEFYSGLFNFKNLDKRLDLYSIEYNLENLILYPNAKEIKQTIAKIIKFEKYF